MTDNGIYGVWLQQVLGEGSRKAPLLIRYFGSCRKVYEADDIELRLSGLLTPAELQKFAQTPIDMAEEIVEACHRLRYGIITPDDENYPKRLLNIPASENSRRKRSAATQSKKSSTRRALPRHGRTARRPGILSSTAAR